MNALVTTAPFLYRVEMPMILRLTSCGVVTMTAPDSGRL